ncbi:MAG: UbiX family flavin prenyltransferase, partial [Firmicutes bacterium]|nr:UbiX family flavin prenyltransferase [Bacillota bacterium]
MCLTLALTGATGSGYGVALLKRLVAREDVTGVDLLLTPMGRRCLQEECGVSEADLAALHAKIHLQREADLGAAISSGSHLQEGMVILPCSAGTLGRIASGTSETLVARAADVCLKERRTLILCVRETPLNRIHL